MKKREAARNKPNAAFLLSQVGAHAAEVFAKLIAPLELTPAHSGIIWMLGRSAGMSQRQLASIIKIHPSRLVALLDEMEDRGLVERQGHAADRRLYALHLTPKGRTTFEKIMRLSQKHLRMICGALNKKECEQLAEFLQRIAQDRGLVSGVHPGYRWL
ncbi:MAG TPA: MarR family winged helix-turn-helix transcriptional regulator, partial [Pyrinomonadaceae bacterium]|nr:MarR family winged helix-turn-helix transcriptional regulator [Pyrinomonadaceae bacterium]